MLKKAVKLMKELKKFDNAYFVKEPLIDDSDYDKRKEILVKLNRQLKDIKISKYLDSVGINSNSSKVTLPVQMGSLTKIKVGEKNKLALWLKKMFDAHDRRPKHEMPINFLSFMTSPKLDGIALCIHYHKNKFVAAYTRGDGIEGQDVTKHMQPLLDSKMIPGKIPKGFGNAKEKDLYFTGELLLGTKKFAVKWKKNGDEGYDTPRVAVSGYINADEPLVKLGKDLTFICYGVRKSMEDEFSVIPEEGRIPGISSKLTVLSAAKNAGFKTFIKAPRFGFYSINKELSINEFQEIIDNSLNADVSGFPFELDGLVVEVAALSTRGNADKDNTKLRPIHSFAYKVSAKKSKDFKISKVTKIVWNTVQSGAIVPTVEFEPVEIRGTTVGKAFVHNIPKLEKLGITKGCTIKVVKAGDIIPEIIGVKPGTGQKKLKHPEKCECGAPAIRPTKPGKKELLPNYYCSKPQKCNALELTKLIGAIKYLDIDGVSKGRLTSMYENGIKNIIMLKTVKSTRLRKIPKFGETVVATIQNNVTNRMVSLSVVDKLVISGVFITPGFSLAASRFEKIVEVLKLTDRKIEGLNVEKAFKKIEGAKGLGESVATCFTKNYKAFVTWNTKLNKVGT